MISSKQFFKYLQEPDQLTDSSVVEMEQLIKQFPFFQTAHLLYLQSLKKINKKLVREKLPVESLYVADRKILYSLLKEELPVAPKTETKSEVKTEVKTDVKTEVKTENKPEVKVEVKTVEKKVEEKKVEVQKEADEKKVEEKKAIEQKVEDKKVEDKKVEKTEKKKLSHEERKVNHEQLVKDFFGEKEDGNYATVATNIAEDGSIKSAAANFAKDENVNQAVVVGAKKEPEKPVEVRKVEVKTVEVKKEEPKVEIKKEEPKVEEKTESKDKILDKIASLRKEKEEVKKEIEKAKEAEAAAQAAAEKAAAEKAAAEKAAADKAAAAATVTTTTTTTTVVTQTVTTKVKDEEEKLPEKKEEKPEEKKELSAAEKLLAKLKKNYPTEDNNKTEVKTETVVTEVKTDNNTSLIDKFLQDSPHLDRNKEVAAGDMGQDSIKQPELASEKLAKIYITQKLFDKAIASYTKLVKDYPDKSEYFNAKIKEIENMKNNQ